MPELTLNSGLVEALGWTLLHSLWQAVVLAAILWVASRILRTARWRYRVAYGTLLAQLLASIATFGWLYEAAATTSRPAGTAVYAVFSAAETGGSWNPAALLFWVVVFWAVGLLCGALRLGVSLGRVRGMRSKASRQVPPAFRERVAVLAARLGYRGPLRIGVSAFADGPALIGHLKPMLLFPVAVVNQLSPEAAEAIILHELAHLRRRDHWWNLLQCIVEVIFYYHPVMWWIGARIREEREHCCDDLVLRHGPDRLVYARALLYFEENRTTPATAVALTNVPGGLLGRVQRFLHQQNIPYQMKSRLLLLPILALVALVTTAAYHPDAAPAPAPQGTPDHLPALTPASGSFTINTDNLPAPLPAATVARPDTLPQGRHQVTSYRNGKSTSVIVEDGAIQELKIDGETIPPAEFDEHTEMVERLLGVEDRRPSVYFFNGNGLLEDSDNQLEDLQFQLERSGELWEDRLEDLEGRFELYDGDKLEELSERMGQLGERMGRSFSRMFRFDNDGGSFYLDFNGNGESPFYFDLDSLRSDHPEGLWDLRDDSDDDDSRPRIYRYDGETRELRDLLEERENLKSKRSSLEEEEDELRRMETMIERLERRKAEKQRALEQRRARGEGDGSPERRERDEEERIRELARQERSAAARSQARLAEIERDNALRLAELRAAERHAALAAERANAAAGQAKIAMARAEVSAERTRSYGEFVGQLQEEGLLPSGELRKLTLDNDDLRFNGKKASAAAHARFLDLIRERYGEDTLGKNFRVRVTHDEN